MPYKNDGPATQLFRSVRLGTRETIASLRKARVSEEMRSKLSAAPQGSCIFRGLPFNADRIAIAAGAPSFVSLPRVTGRWLVFLHTTDALPLEANEHGFHSPLRRRARRKVLQGLRKEESLVRWFFKDDMMEARRTAEVFNNAPVMSDRSGNLAEEEGIMTLKLRTVCATGLRTCGTLFRRMLA